MDLSLEHYQLLNTIGGLIEAGSGNPVPVDTIYRTYNGLQSEIPVDTFRHLLGDLQRGGYIHVYRTPEGPVVDPDIRELEELVVADPGYTYGSDISRYQNLFNQARLRRQRANRKRRALKELANRHRQELDQIYRDLED